MASRHQCATPLRPLREGRPNLWTTPSVDNPRRLSGPGASMAGMAGAADSVAAERALGRFSTLTRAWFESAFAAPTPAQVGAAARPFPGRAAGRLNPPPGAPVPVATSRGPQGLGQVETVIVDEVHSV